MDLTNCSICWGLLLLSLHGNSVSGQRCPPHPAPNFGFSECSNLRKHKSICETKCENGYRLRGPSRMMCWCKGTKCEWTGVKASCEEVNCNVPDASTGSLRFADAWTGGFAFLVEMTNIVAPPESDYGWSIVIIFDRPLGKTVSLLSWNLDLTATSYDGQTFTFVNPKHRVQLSRAVDENGRFSALILAENVGENFPESAFVGLYYRRVRDATCLVAPMMPPIEPLYSNKNNFMLTDTTKAPTTTTPFTTITIKRLNAIAKKFQKPKTRSSLPPTTTVGTTSTTTKLFSTTTSKVQPQITATETASKMPPSTSRLATGTAQKAVPSPTTPKDGSFCQLQTHEDYFVTNGGWEDRGVHYFKGNVYLLSSAELGDWRMVIVFENNITQIETWACEVVHSSADGKIWTFGPHPWNTRLKPGLTDILFIATQAYATVGAATAQVFLCSDSFTSGDAVMGGTGLGMSNTKETSVKESSKSVQVATTSASSKATCSASSPKGRPVIRAEQTKQNFKQNNDETKYNYNEVIHKSILFYEAQRSGPLPDNNRIPWRGDSGLKDGCEIGVDATGGWYDAGDMVKFHFPMAFSLTTLAWGGIAFRDAYEDAGELENMIECIKWTTEYFIKTHISKYKVVGQVGHGQTDHNYWGRPEQMNMNRPTYILSEKKPGTELAAEVAAALAASSIFLRATHSELADRALAHSKQLFEFADKYRGTYSVSIPDASLYYKSYSGYHDELVWGAAWLYKATNNSMYLTAAETFYEKMRGKYKIAAEFAWDDKLAGAQVLLTEITGKNDYRKPFTQFLNNLPRRKKTPQGLYYLSDWGPNRYAANTALMLILGARLTPALPKRKDYLKWAEKQIGLLLGDAGRSFVVGFGKNPPLKAHHAASSCPPYPERCDWTTYHSSKPNHYVLYGALIGGPDQKGVFGDNRSNFRQTEVACDYNAGFQSAVAGLKHHAMLKRASTTTTTSASKPTTKSIVTESKATPKPATSKPKSACRPRRSRKCAKARLAAKKARLG